MDHAHYAINVTGGELSDAELAAYLERGKQKYGKQLLGLDVHLDGEYVELTYNLRRWAGYCVLGLGMAYFQFRKGKPGLVSSVFTPLLGEKGVNGPVGKLIDILAIFATAGGIATSLGLGAMQINSGLNKVFGVPENKVAVFVIVAVITVIYIWTAVAGVDKGIKKVCDMNVVVAGLLMLICLAIGPTVDILCNLVEGTGNYV